VIRKHTRRAAKAAFAISLAVALLIGLLARPAASAPDASKPTVILGTKNFAEEYILGQLYKQALEAKGFKVTYKENIGSTEIIDTALTSGKINMYPEYTGVIVQVVFHKPLSAKTARATYELAKRLQETRGFTLFNPTPFFDTDAIATLKTTAAKYGLSSVPDLKKVKGLTLGGQPEFRTRNTGLVGLRNIYGITSVKFVPLAGISPYAALDAGKVQAAAVFSTDPPLGAGSKYKVLSDPKHLFGFQNVAPVVSMKLAKALGPSFRTTIDKVSAKLTTPAIIAMNKAVIVDQQKPAGVAKAFLKANGLL
jgi:osmoprotectant transport system substrate-binding protein